jgi:hypothetical protein
VTVFPGVDLPGLVGHLRGLSGTTAEEDFDAGLLRSLVGPDDKGIAPVIDRYASLSPTTCQSPEAGRDGRPRIRTWRIPCCAMPPTGTRSRRDSFLCVRIGVIVTAIRTAETSFVRPVAPSLSAAGPATSRRS